MVLPELVVTSGSYDRLVILDDVSQGPVTMLFPHFTGVRVDRVVAAAAWLDSSGCEATVDCPVCVVVSDRVHSRCERTLTDRGLCDREVVIRVQERLSRSHHHVCAQRSFAEQIPA